MLLGLYFDVTTLDFANHDEELRKSLHFGCATVGVHED